MIGWVTDFWQILPYINFRQKTKQWRNSQRKNKSKLSMEFFYWRWRKVGWNQYLTTSHSSARSLSMELFLIYPQQLRKMLVTNYGMISIPNIPNIEIGNVVLVVFERIFQWTFYAINAKCLKSSSISLLVSKLLLKRIFNKVIF